MHEQVLGTIHYDRGAYADARDATSRALALAESEHNPWLVIGVHLDLAAIECAAGALADSAVHLATAENLNPETAHGTDDAFLIARADLALARGDNVEALEFAEAAAALEDESYSAGVQGVANLRYLGDAQLGVGNATNALSTYQQLIVRAATGQYACRLAEGHEGCAAAAYALGDRNHALEHLAVAAESANAPAPSASPVPPSTGTSSPSKPDTPRTPRRCGSTPTQRRATTSTTASRAPNRPTDT